MFFTNVSADGPLLMLTLSTRAVAMLASKLEKAPQYSVVQKVQTPKVYSVPDNLHTGVVHNLAYFLSTAVSYQLR